MIQSLLFIAALVGLFSIVPLVTWAATGSSRHAWVAFREYMQCIGLLLVICVIGVIAALIGSIP